jgi:RNA polymerase sigma-70 factor (ECF subfamily)
MENGIRDARVEIMGAVNRLRACAIRWSPNSDDADDLIQATAERALQTRAQYRPGTNATAWVRAIMYHLAVDGARRRCRERALHEAYGHESPDHQPAIEDDLVAPAPPRRWPSMAEVRLAAAELRQPIRATFLLWAVERLSYREIGRRQSIPINTVATRLLRARRDLRLILKARDLLIAEGRAPGQNEAIPEAA